MPVNKSIVATFADRIYCINLDSRTDRWLQVSDEFRRIGIDQSVERVSGIVDGDPRIGCLRSHQWCVNDALKHGYRRILVLEDDVHFYDVKPEAASAAVDFLDTNDRWDLFYLGGMVMYPARFLSPHVFTSKFFSTHAYIINQRAYHRVLEATPPIDIWYAENMYSCGIFPLYASQIESYSDIRKTIIANREDAFLRKYRMLVEPPFLKRWTNYIHSKYVR